MNSDALWLWFAIGFSSGAGLGYAYRDERFNVVVNILIDIAAGLAGAIGAGWLGDKLGLQIGPGLITEVVTSAVGASVFLALERVARRWIP
jgi:uncharacterized membrane protein YeaQ/YmgE (transglycosylase-associated protein family)